MKAEVSQKDWLRSGEALLVLNATEADCALLQLHCGFLHCLLIVTLLHCWCPSYQMGGAISQDSLSVLVLWSIRPVGLFDNVLCRTFILHFTSSRHPLHRFSEGATLDFAPHGCPFWNASHNQLGNNPWSFIMYVNLTSTRCKTFWEQMWIQSRENKFLLLCSN